MFVHADQELASKVHPVPQKTEPVAGTQGSGGRVQGVLGNRNFTGVAQGLQRSSVSEQDQQRAAQIPQGSMQQLRVLGALVGQIPNSAFVAAKETYGV